MAAENPRIIIYTAEEKIELTPHNSAIYNFIGRATFYNHIEQVNNARLPGGLHLAHLIFRRSPLYHVVARDMVLNNFQLYDGLKLPQHFADNADLWREAILSGRYVIALPALVTDEMEDILSANEQKVFISPEADQQLASSEYQLDGRTKPKPLPSPAEVPYQMFEYFWQQAEQGLITHEQATALSRLWAEPVSK